MTTKLVNDKRTVGAIMSVPRMGFTDNFDCVVSSLIPFDIPIMISRGVFWHQVIEQAMETQIRRGREWILTVDFDSLFTAADLSKMFRLINENPGVDAIFPVQVKRHFGKSGKDHKILCSVGGNELTMQDIEGSPKLLDVDTGHFGFTLIKAEALMEMPKPWFQFVPNQFGFWNRGERQDADIYFWNRWKEAGKTLKLATEVQIGHLQEMVLLPDAKSGISYVDVTEWRTRNGELEQVDA